MLLTELMDNMRGEMTVLGITLLEERSFFLAAAHQESASGANVTTLASIYNNVFGIHWRQADAGKYARKTMRGNQFEGAKLVDYRVYPTLLRCIEIERINKILRPALYADLKELYSDGYPQNPNARPDWPNWITAMAARHCDENPDHAREVLKLWRYYCALDRGR